VDSGKIGADEINLLGNGESSTVSLSSTDSLALIVKLAALPAAKVEELILPPFRSTSLAVLIVTAPASPALRELEDTVLVEKRGDTPISSTASVAFTVTGPPLPVPKLGDDTDPPSRAINRPVDTVIVPPSPELNWAVAIELIRLGFVGEDPIN
jgi:hypothetical protein